MRQLNPMQVTELVKTILSTDPSTVIGLVGDMGIGKTHATLAAPAALRIPSIIWALAQEAQEDIAGIPDTGLLKVFQDIRDLLVHTLIKKEQNPERVAAIVDAATKPHGNYLDYKMPFPFKTIQQHERGLLFYDEINRAIAENIQPIFPLIEEGKRTIRNVKLPEGWGIVLAMNPDNGYYNVNELPPAFERRVTWIEVVFDFEAWYKYATDSGYHQVITDFGRANPNLIWDKPEDIEDKVKPNPASYATINRWFAKGILSIQTIQDPIAQALLAGKIGEKPTLAFTRYCIEKYTRPVTAKEVFEGNIITNKKIREKFFKQQGSGQNDKITTTLHDCIAYIKSNAVEKNGTINANIVNAMVYLIKSKEFKAHNRTMLMKEVSTIQDLISAILQKDQECLQVLRSEVNANKAKREA